MSTFQTDLHARIKTAVLNNRDRTSQLLLDLVAAESVTGNESEVQGVLARELESRRLSLDIWVATREEVAPYLMHVGDQKVWENRPNIVARRAGAGGGPTLMMQGHIDTVPIEDPSLWTTNPAGEIRDGLVYGRGAADMKGGVASFIAALDALDTAGIRLKGDLLLATTVG
ncbi:MAG: M20/M25/M40 family metallo-hydrolase, partial [Thermomicrobiales bacterium]